MSTLIVAVLAFFGFIIAYHTYGKWLGRRIFELDDDRLVPSKELRDDVDYVPAKKQVIFGHHFTSSAGTGPIVGPAGNPAQRARESLVHVLMNHNDFVSVR